MLLYPAADPTNGCWGADATATAGEAIVRLRIKLMYSDVIILALQQSC